MRALPGALSGFAFACAPILALALALIFALILILALPATQVQAQAYQCRPPASLEVPHIKPDGPRRPMPVQGYTMALSWSPAFCRTRSAQPAHKVQCSGKNGRFALVVHGLWPEGRRAGARAQWPQWCPARQALTRAHLQRNLCMMPSARLIARQWAKHGSCMGLPAQTYFKITRILWSSYLKPDYDRLSRKQGLSAGDIRGAFADANKGIERAHIGVKLNAKGWFEELRICYDKRFMPHPCDSARFGAADGDAAQIWRGM